jgi:hypothetical protein
MRVDGADMPQSGTKRTATERDSQQNTKLQAIVWIVVTLEEFTII